MTNLRHYFWWAALYLVAMIYRLVTMFFSSLTRVSTSVPIAVGGYIGPGLLINRSYGTNSTELPVTVLGFLLLEAGIWATHQLAVQIAHGKCVRDTLAVQELPKVTQQLHQDNQSIKSKTTFSRSWHMSQEHLLDGMQREGDSCLLG